MAQIKRAEAVSYSYQTNLCTLKTKEIPEWIPVKRQFLKLHTGLSFNLNKIHPFSQTTTQEPQAPSSKPNILELTMTL